MSKHKSKAEKIEEAGVYWSGKHGELDAITNRFPEQELLDIIKSNPEYLDAYVEGYLKGLIVGQKARREGKLTSRERENNG